MPESGQRARSAATGGFALLGALCALVPALAMWGFAVDDALIPVRYAHNFASGAGYRFDAQGPSTDGVTPLPWAFVLAPLAGGDAMVTLVRAKVLGVVAWTIAGALLGARAGKMVSGGGRAVTALAAAALVVMGVAFPIGAWAASGMETGVAIAIATVAAARLGVGRARGVAAIAGMVGVIRPEMVVWAMVLGGGAALVGSATGRERESAARSVREAAVGVAIAAVPFVGVAAIRGSVFGRMAPLAVLAKPSDVAHGLAYAGAAALVVLSPILVAAPVALLRGRDVAVARVIVVAFLAHVMVVVAVGGDWMPYARLMVPVAPSLVIGFGVIAREARAAWSAARIATALVLGVLLAIHAAPAGRTVHRDRADLVARARPVLRDAKVVAALDIGWTSAATDARIVDLAGLTDPSIALLPGGHTSKRVDPSMLLDRGVDTVVVYSEMRVVEARLVRSELFAARFEAKETLPVGTRGASYTLYRRRARDGAP